MFHPYFPEKNMDLTEFQPEPLVQPLIKKGVLVRELPSIAGSAEYARKRLAFLGTEYKRFENPHIYKVGISKRVMNLQRKLLDAHRKGRKP